MSAIAVVWLADMFLRFLEQQWMMMACEDALDYTKIKDTTD